jgi:hypothetical protein
MNATGIESEALQAEIAVPFDDENQRVGRAIEIPGEYEISAPGNVGARRQLRRCFGYSREHRPDKECDDERDVNHAIAP